MDAGAGPARGRAVPALPGRGRPDDDRRGPIRRGGDLDAPRPLVDLLRDGGLRDQAPLAEGDDRGRLLLPGPGSGGPVDGPWGLGALSLGDGPAVRGRTTLRGGRALQHSGTGPWRQIT